MTRAERVELLLAGASAEERSRLRPVEWAASYLSLSKPSVYRLVAGGLVPHVKLAGGLRKSGKGRAGSVRFRLADLAAWSVENEAGA